MHQNDLSGDWQHHNTVRCAWFLFPFLKQEIDIHLQRKVPLWCCGIELYRPRDPGQGTQALHAPAHPRIDRPRYKHGTRGDREHAYTPLTPIRGKTWSLLTWADTHTWQRICRCPTFPRGDSTTPQEEKIYKCAHSGGSNKRNLPSTTLPPEETLRGAGHQEAVNSPAEEPQSRLTAWLLQLHGWRGPFLSPSTWSTGVGGQDLGEGRGGWKGGR